MNTVGLTGGIGSGKTIISEVFNKLGIVVYNSDFEAKMLMNTDDDIINKLKMIFGYDIYDINNKLKRKKLAALIFRNKDKLNTVNSIVHPVVKKHFENWKKNQTSPYLIKETAILFESKMNKDVQKIITVTAPIEIRIKRISERDHIPKNQILQRINNQIDDMYKINHSDYVIYNNEIQLVLPQILSIHNKLLKYFN